MKHFDLWSDLRPHRNRIALISALSVMLPLTASASTPSPLKIELATASTDDGNVPANAIDGISSTRWSGLGPGAYITFDLGSTMAVSAMDVAWYLGNQRRSTFTVSGSADGKTWTSLYSGESSGTTASYENYDITNASARYLRVTVAKNTVNAWASITDVRIYGSSTSSSSASSYDNLVLTDHPAAFWDMKRSSGTEPDVSGNGNTGTYKGGTPSGATMPNGEQAADFNGSSQYLTVPSKATMSIPTTGNLTWEAWIRPDVLQFPSNPNYIDWMGKCQEYSPTCEWEARMYNTTNSQGRCNRISAYAFNPTAGLGSAADWQPVCGLIQAGKWYHVVGEYTTLSQPSTCSSSYPGSINIWVNGVLWSQSSHNPTGCMSQYDVKPKANNSPVNIGTMALDKWFKGAIGKVAIYNYLLTQTQITKHYQTMTGKTPTGSCGSTCTF